VDTILPSHERLHRNAHAPAPMPQDLLAVTGLLNPYAHVTIAQAGDLCQVSANTPVHCYPIEGMRRSVCRQCASTRHITVRNASQTRSQAPNVRDSSLNVAETTCRILEIPLSFQKKRPSPMEVAR
jgi:hypothetical protein